MSRCSLVHLGALKAHSYHSAIHSARRLLSGLLLAPWLFGLCGLNLARALGAEPSPGLRPDTDAALVGELGDTDLIRFEGVTTFRADSLRNALAHNTAFLLAAHPEAPREPFLKLLRQKVLSGYEHSGFPEVKVTTAVAPNADCVTVAVTEGPRFRCGRVHVTGMANRAAVAAIVKKLTEVVPKSALSHLGLGAGHSSDSPAKDQDTHAHLQTEPRAELLPLQRDPNQVSAAPDNETSEGPVWKPGELAVFGQIARRNIEVAAKECLADFGLFFPVLSSSNKFEYPAGTADLFLVIEDPGPRGTISELVVTGNRKNSRREILNFVALKPGMEITRSLLAKAEEKLFRSARFLDYEIKPELVGDNSVNASRVRLVLSVKEYERAPRLADSFSKEQKILLRTHDWLSGFQSRSEDMVLSGSMATNASQFAVTAAFSPRDGALFRSHDPAGLVSGSYDLLFAKDALALYPSGRGYQFLLSQPKLSTLVEIGLKSNAGETNKPFSFDLGVGFNPLTESEIKDGEKPGFHLQMKLAPVAFLYFLENDCRTTLKQGVLNLQTSNLVMRIRAKTGRLEQFEYRSDDKLAQLCFAEGAFARARQELENAAAGCVNRYDSNHPLSSLVGFATTELARWRVLGAFATNFPAASRERATAALNQLLGPTILAPLDQAAASTNSQEAFSIPLDDLERAQAQNGAYKLGAGIIFGMSNNFLPKRSWPWTIAHEAVFVLGQQTAYTGAELERLYDSEDTGPLGCLVVASLLSNFRPEQAQAFAGRGLTRLSANDFRRDCLLFLDGTSGLATSFANACAALRQLPRADLEALASLLPEHESALLLHCAKVLREAPTQPLVTSLGPALDAYWQNSLRAKVRAALWKLSRPPPAKNERRI